MKKKELCKVATIVLLLAAFMGSCNKKDNFVEVPGACPIVIATSPANGATSVPLAKVVTVTFNEQMNPLSITQSSFTIQGTAAVAGTITYSGNTASFTPTIPLLPNTTYTGKVSTSVKDANGNALQADYIWTFSTGTNLAPVVISTDPANNATGVVLNKIITAKFSLPMDPLTINTTTLTIQKGNLSIAGTVTYTDTTATFTPSVDLIPNTIYTGTIATGVKSATGIPMAVNYVWTFTTGTIVAPTVIATDPVSNASAVPLTKIITATFNMLMDPLTITATSFTLKQGATVVAGTVTYTGTTASFTPSGSLLPGTTYTATITTGAKNIAGTSLANNYTWVFNTVSTGAPAVISIDPANNAIGVPLNKTVTATFNMPMDPLTINAGTFTIMQGLTPVTGTISYVGTTASFTPAVNLSPGMVYTATIATGAKNVAGTLLVNNYVWIFTTGIISAPTVISTVPANNATAVLFNQVVTATFSMPMDPLTINSTTFTLKTGTVLVAGIVSYSGSTTSFTPSSNLLSSTLYTATITTGAKNLAGTPLASDYVWSFTTKTSLGPTPPNLNSVARFGIIAGVGVSNNAGFSQIQNMDVGISPGVRSSITGFPPAIIVNGAIYASDDIAPPGVTAMLVQAKQDLTDAYLFAESATTPAPTLVSGDQGGKTLAPGIYKTTSTLLIQSGDLTLDAQGDVNAVWIFQVATGFTTIGGAGGNVILSGGAQAKNVYWQVGSSATIGDFTAFKGNVLALTSITMNSGAVAVGRMLARNGAVVMTNTNFIIKP
jgi:hypothetical protein